MDILTVLKALEDLEGKAALLYEKYGEAFSNDAEAASFFKGMARVEQAHFNIVKFQIGLVWKERNQFRDVDLDLDEVHQCVDLLRAALAENSVPTLEEALRLSIRLENSGSELQYRAAIIESNPKIKGLIESLAKADKGHFDDLCRFVEARGFFPPPGTKN